MGDEFIRAEVFKRNRVTLLPFYNRDFKGTTRECIFRGKRITGLLVRGEYFNIRINPAGPAH